MAAGIKEATKAQRLTEMHDSSKPHIKQVANAITLSVPSIRKHIANHKDITTRFMVRAISDSLPTYKNEAKKVAPGNKYEEMYKDKITGGTCVCCDLETAESNQHIFCECPKYAHLREHAMQAIQDIWGQDHKTRCEWGLVDYVTQKGVEGWQQWWGWMGMVPQQIHDKAGWGQKKRLKQTAAAMADAGYKIWQARNEEVQAWEENNGIKESKKEIRMKHWQVSTQKRERRGRPEKPEEELSPGYRRLKQNKQLMWDLRQQGYTTAEARQTIRLRNRHAITKAVADTHYQNTTIQQWTQAETKQTFKPHMNQEHNIRPSGITERKYIHSRGKPTKIPKRLKLLDKIALNDDQLEAFRTARQDGKCAFGACGNPATTVSALCTCDNKDPRCEEHKYFLCRGKRGTMECRCAINAEMVEIREPKTGIRRRNPTGEQNKTDHEQKPKKHRSYTVDIGDTVQLEDYEEGIKQGTVKHMVWIKHGGFRVPDAMEIEWKTETGETITGEIRMNDGWTVIQRRRREVQTGAGHLRFSSQEKNQEKGVDNTTHTADTRNTKYANTVTESYCNSTGIPMHALPVLLPTETCEVCGGGPDSTIKQCIVCDYPYCGLISLTYFVGCVTAPRLPRLLCRLVVSYYYSRYAICRRAPATSTAPLHDGALPNAPLMRQGPTACAALSASLLLHQPARCLPPLPCWIVSQGWFIKQHK